MTLSLSTETPPQERSRIERGAARAGRLKSPPWRLVSFALVVLLPTLIAAIYLLGIAADQYVSAFGFSIEHAQPLQGEPASTRAEAGASVAVATLESEQIIQYIASREMVEAIDRRLGLRARFAAPQADRFSRLDPSLPIERVVDYWRGMVDPFFDLSTGLITVSVRAFRPADAQAIAAAILAVAEQRVNDLAHRARRDSLAFAEAEVDRQGARLRQAETAILDFRSRNGTLDPALQAAGASTLDGKLRAELADARAAYDTAHRRGVAPAAPQLKMLQSRIDSLVAELARQPQATAKPLSDVLTGYENLQIDEKLAEKGYDSALEAERRASDIAGRQQTYLSAYVRPELAESPLYPRRWRGILLVFLTGAATWCLGSLLYQSVRDHIG